MSVIERFIINRDDSLTGRWEEPLYLRTGLYPSHAFGPVRRPEASIPESRRRLSRRVSNAASIDVCFCSTSETPALYICSAAVLKRLLLTSSIVTKANACARGTPSAPVCRNSMCAFTFPKTVPKAISPSVPSGIGPLTSRADPPVNERRWMIPTNFRSSTVKIAFCWWGTRILGGRCLRGLSILRGIVSRITTGSWAVKVT